jgi:hypothetical protein
MQGRIKRGAGIFQDRNFCKWPNCCPPRSEYESEEYQYEAKDPDMVFEVEWTGNHWDCKADGYGMLRSHGGLSWWGRTLSVVAYRNLKFTPPSKPTLFHYFTRKSCIGKMQRVAPTTQVVKPLFSINDP